jgi:hypothetical protein
MPMRQGGQGGNGGGGEKLFTAAELDARVEAARAQQAAHDVKGNQQVRMSAEYLAKDVASILAPHLNKPTETPGWLRVGGPAVAMGVGILTIVGVVGNMALAPLMSRVASIETKSVDISAALGSHGQRLQAVETRQATTASVRDQQLEGLRDRVTAMERADQAQLERANAIATTIAGILPRLEEILRRQERLETRLGSPMAPRPNSDDDTPARWRIPDRET